MIHNTKNSTKKGFTLVELTIVILIVAILFIILTISVNAMVNKSKEAGLEVDFHSYYVGAKSAILVADEETLADKTKFVELMNEYTDDEIEVSSDLVTCNKDDPWNQTYEFRWRSRVDAQGRTEHYVAFISEGVGARPGWIFEPDKPVSDREKMYWIDPEYRTDVDGRLWRYVELLGYYDNGTMIESITDPDGNGIEDDIKWVITGDASTTQWAYLTFYVDAEGVEVDTTELNSKQQIVTVDSSMTPGGIGKAGVGPKGILGIGGTPPDHGSGTGGKELPKGGSYAFIEPDVSTPGYSGLYLGTGWNAPVINSPDITQDDLNSVLAGKNSYISGTEVVDSRRKVTIEVGNGNQINVYFDETDKLPNANWFKIGSDVDVEAVPASGWEFKYWTIDGVRTETNPYTLSPVTADTTFVAKFRMALDINGGIITTSDGTPLVNYVASENANMENNLSKYLWAWTVDGSTAKLTKYYGEDGADKNLVIPSTIDGLTVVSVGGSKDNNGLSGKTFGSVSIPNGITVESETFYGSTIKDLTIEDNVQLSNKSFTATTIDNLTIGELVGIYSNSSQETSFSCAGGETTIKNIVCHSDIPAYTFKKVDAEKVTIAIEVTNIGNEAFYGNDNLDTIIYE